MTTSAPALDATLIAHDSEALAPGDPATAGTISDVPGLKGLPLAESALSGLRSPHVLDLTAALELRGVSGATAPDRNTPEELPTRNDGGTSVSADTAVSSTPDTSSGSACDLLSCIARPERDTCVALPARSVTSAPAGLRPRDGEVLRAIAQMRLLSLAQIARLFFPGHPSAARRRMRALEQRGWVRLFEERLTFGGHPKYALPTARALRFAYRALQDESTKTASETTVRTMLADQPRTAMELAPFTAPAFLPHQRETNDALIACRQSYPLGVMWASAFERPFPTRASGSFLPQPDFVLICAPFGQEPRLVFGELDRGSEPVQRFARRKVDAYRSLRADRSCERLTGFASFEVWVVVSNVAAERPLRRIAVLQETVRSRFASEGFRFTLLDWVMAAPEQPIWFTTTSPDLTIEGVNLTAHVATGRTAGVLDLPPPNPFRR